jgi:G3E family GTPase
MERRGAFDYILLETSGLADPGNIAPLFWVDEGLGSSIYLDGVVTVVDSVNIQATLASKKESSSDQGLVNHEETALDPAHNQVSHADVILVNKTDLVSKEKLGTIREDIEVLNGLAKIQLTRHGVVSNLVGTILDLHAYDRVTSEEMSSKKLYSHLDPVRFQVTFQMSTS